MDIIDNDAQQHDEIYQGLKKTYSDKFMSLTPSERQSIANKQIEFTILLKKSV
jgi:hypothetical protein